MDRRDSARESAKSNSDEKEEEVEYDDSGDRARGDSGEVTKDECDEAQHEGKLKRHVDPWFFAVRKERELNEPSKLDVGDDCSGMTQSRHPPSNSQRQVHTIEADGEKRNPSQIGSKDAGPLAAKPADSLASSAIGGSSVREVNAKNEAYLDYGRDFGTDEEFFKREKSGGLPLEPTTVSHEAHPPELNADHFDPELNRGAWRVAPGGVTRLDRRRQLPDDDSSERGSSPEEDVALRVEDANISDDDATATATATDQQRIATVATLVEEFDLVAAKVDRSRRKRIIRIGSLVLLVVVVTIVAVSVGVTMSSRRSPSPPPPTQPPTLPPTIAPIPVTKAMVDAVLNDSRLTNSTVSAIFEEGTPQFKAFQWLRMKVNGSFIHDDSNPVNRLVQQFVLAVLYYSSTSTEAASGGSTGGGWTNDSGWLLDDDECQWSGCHCNRTVNGSWELHVLDLTHNDLETGFLPMEIGILDSLVSLDLSSNGFVGTIPSELGLLSLLQLLSLTNNTLTGSLPSELYNATNLTSLDLDKNKLSGTLSSLIGRLSKLTSLNLWAHDDLSGNEDFSGRLPTELGLLTGLSQLVMRSVQFSGGGTIPRELGQMSALTTLVLSGYAFQGTIPADLSKLTQLNTLEVSMNDLTGTVPSELGLLTSLNKLDVRENERLSGTVPDQLCNLIHSNNLALCVTQTAVSCSCGCACI